MWQSVSSKSLDHEKIARKWGLASDDKEIGAKVSLVRNIHAFMINNIICLVWWVKIQTPSKTIISW